MFLCGSCEPGKDGVGDYTVRLAQKLVQEHCGVSIIALNDRYVDADTDEKRIAGNTDIKILRLSKKTGWPQKLAMAQQWVNAYKPDWVSLQYVPFSFNDKGLPFGLGAFINKLVSGSKIQIMCHELWVGVDRGASLKMRVWGKLQKHLLLRLIKMIQPGVIHTHSQLYKKLLQQQGLDIALLPLFGNIPVKAPVARREKSAIQSFVIFGGIHFGADAAAFCKWLVKEAGNQKVRIDFIGNNGASVNEWVQACETCNVEYKVHGLQDVEYIAGLMNEATAGITTTPYFLSEKSGSVAAMLEFGLPVICVARTWIPAGVNIKELDILPVTEWTEDLNMNNFLSSRHRGFSAADIAEKFLHSLNNN